MRIRMKFGWLGLIVLCFSTALYGQNYPFSTFTNQNGLPGMQVMRLFQDSRNRLWLSTKTGLAYFDGNQFHTLSAKEFPEINPFRLGGFAETRDRSIWFANEENVYRYDGQKLEKHTLPANWQVERHERIYINRHDQVLAVAHNLENLDQKTLFCFQKGKKARQILLPPLPWDGYFIPKWFDSRNDTWYGSIRRSDTEDRPLVYLHRGKWKILSREIGHNEDFEPYLHPKTGSPLIRTENAKRETVYLEVIAPGHVQEVARGKEEKYTIQKSLPYSLLLHFDHHVYFIPAHASSGTKMELNHSIINDVVLSHEGSGFFVATEKGLRHIFDNGFRYFDESQAPYVWTVVEDKRDGVWFGNFGGGLTYWRPGQSPRLEDQIPIHQIQALHPNLSSPKDLQFYYGGFRDSDGNAWFPEVNGLLHFNATSNTFQFANAETCFAIGDDPENNLVWQGNHEGLIATHKASKKRIIHLKIGRDIPMIRYFMVLFKDSKGRYWFGGKGGMLRFDSFQAIQQRKYTHFKPGASSFPRIGFMQMHEDPYGTIWGASGDGLFWWDEPSQTFKSVAHAQLESPVTSVISSDRHSLWIGTNDALLKMDLARWHREKKAQMVVFNHHTGFLGQEVAQSGLYLDSQRRLWVPSGSVLSYLDLNHIHSEISPTQPYINKIGKRRMPHVQGGLDQVFEENHLMMDVGATGYHRPLRAHFSYRVDDETWSDWTEQTQIYLPTLTNGRHTIEVRSQTLGWEGEEPNVARQVIVIQAPIWKSPNFAKYLTLILIGLSLIGGIGYIRHLRVRAAWMEAQQRIMQLQLGTLQELLTPHFIYNTLDSIQVLIQRNLPFEANQQIHSLAHILRSYVSVGAGQRKKLFTVQEKIKILEDYIQLLLVRLDEPFTYTLQTDPDVPLQLPLIPPLMIQPYVENSIKHGLLPLLSPGHLTIHFFREGDEIGCRIEDTGQGRTAALAQRSKKSLSVSTELMHERIKILNQLGQTIRVQMSDLFPQGTRVTVYFKIAKHTTNL